MHCYFVINVMEYIELQSYLVCMKRPLSVPIFIIMWAWLFVKALLLYAALRIKCCSRYHKLN